MDTSPRRRRVAVFLLQLGGPKTLADIEPFLANLFADVLPVPRFVRGWLARRVARKRAPLVAPQYQLMGGGSPLLPNTLAQAQALEAELSRRDIEARALIAMRYAPPRALEAIEEARRSFADATWVALPLYPQYSFATTRSSVDELMPQLTAAEQARLQVVSAYPSEPGYLEAVAATIDDALERLPEEAREEAHLVFSAHGLPLRLVKEGDPYPEHIKSTVEGVMARLPHELPYHLCYQSKVGPVRWLTPSAIDTVQRLGREGVKALVVVPVSFVSEHIETLVELDRELQHFAKEAGVSHYVRAETVAVRPAFVGALADLVERALSAAV